MKRQRDKKAFSIYHFILTVCLLGFICVLPVDEVRAAEDDVIILDEDADLPSDRSDFVDFLQRHFFLRGGGFWAGGGGAVSQGFGFVRTGFDYSFDVLGLKQRVYLNGGYTYRLLELELILEEGGSRGDGEPPPPPDPSAPCQFSGSGRDRTCDFKIEVENSDFELREAYGEFEFYPNVILSIGRQRPIWGQFDLFSVVNSILPIEVQSKDFGLSSNNLRMPQDLMSLKIFLFEQIEVSGYLFYQTTLDPLLNEAITQEENYIFYENCTAMVAMGPPAICDPTSRSLAGDLENQDKFSYAARILWRESWLTAGFTFSEGYFSLFNIFNRLPQVRRVVDNNGVVAAYNVSPRFILPEARAFGFELALPINVWTIKGEIVYTQSQADIGLSSNSGDPNPIARDALFEWVLEQNGGRGYVDRDTVTAQIGFSADYDRWVFGLNILFFENILTNEAKQANRLFKAWRPGDDSLLEPNSDLSGIPFPTAYLFYNFGAEKEHQLGIAGGFLGILAGGTIFYTGTQLFGEHFNWTASAEYTTNLASQLISQSNDTNRDIGGSSVSLTEDFTLSFRVGATFEF